MSSKRYERKIWVINPGFQYRMVAYGVLLTVLLVGVLYGSELYFFEKFAASGKNLGLAPDHAYFQFLSQQKAALAKIYLVVSAAFLAVISFVAILLSHRIAGPVYRLCKVMSEGAQGTPIYPIRFRDNDFFPELAENYNQLMEKIGQDGQQAFSQVKKGNLK